VPAVAGRFATRSLSAAGPRVAGVVPGAA
jgi:hypothetical protein